MIEEFNATIKKSSIIFYHLYGQPESIRKFVYHPIHYRERPEIANFTNHIKSLRETGKKGKKKRKEKIGNHISPVLEMHLPRRVKPRSIYTAC